MSSTWRYVHECKQHLYELCESIEPARRIPTYEQYSQDQDTAPATSREQFWADLVRRLEQHPREKLLQMFVENRDFAVAHLGATPSQRAKRKFASEDDRILATCAALWYGRFAALELTRLEAAGRLEGGVSYRRQTQDAALTKTRALVFSGVTSKTSLRLVPLWEDLDLDLPPKLLGKWCWDIDAEMDSNLAYLGLDE